jgi:hypothetical protein
VNRSQNEELLKYIGMKLFGKGFHRLLEISLQDIINSYITKQAHDAENVCVDFSPTFDLLIIFEIVKDSFHFDYYELEVGSCNAV